MAQVEPMMNPKGSMFQCNLSPKAADVGDSDPTQSDFWVNHSLRNIPSRARRAGFDEEAEYTNENLR